MVKIEDNPSSLALQANSSKVHVHGVDASNLLTAQYKICVDASNLLTAQYKIFESKI